MTEQKTSYLERYGREENGFCYPDWHRAYRDFKASLPEAEVDAAWDTMAREWIGRLRDDLGGNYHLAESKNFAVLSEAPSRVICDALAFFEKALQVIWEETVRDTDGAGRCLVVMFSEDDDYYTYISHYYPEGEFPTSGGICLSNDGYAHLVFQTPDFSAYRTIFVHEMTHVCLVQRPIPSWLNEALAMRMEEIICGTQRGMLDREQLARHRRFWDRETIQTFWTGQSWHLPDEGFELSYDLALIVWRKIEGHLDAPHSEIVEFIKAAHYNDAGEAACREIFEVGLGELVADFLGPGNWSPDPSGWNWDVPASQEE